MRIRWFGATLIILLFSITVSVAMAQTEPQQPGMPSSADVQQPPTQNGGLTFFLPMITSAQGETDSSDAAQQPPTQNGGPTVFLPMITSAQGEMDSSEMPYEYVIIEGDIQVPPEYFQAAISGVETTFATNFWPNGLVPFRFHTNVSVANQALMVAAMNNWEAVANVDFQQCTNNNCIGNHIEVRNSTVNSSFVGMRGGVQIVNIVNWNWHFIIMHELAHALGFWHEQSRADRNAFIQINFANIIDAEEHNFQIRPNGGEYGPYDFGSVMHYGQCAFTINCNGGVNPAITVLPPNQAQQTLIGQRSQLSDMDEVTMSFLYPETSWRFVDRNSTAAQNGTFLAPYRQVTTGVTNTPSGGTLWVQPGTYASAGTFSKPMTIRAPLGGVTLTP